MEQLSEGGEARETDTSVYSSFVGQRAYPQAIQLKSYMAENPVQSGNLSSQDIMRAQSVTELAKQYSERVDKRHGNEPNRAAAFSSSLQQAKKTLAPPRPVSTRRPGTAHSYQASTRVRCRNGFVSYGTNLNYQA
jgi:hypothetical protein